MAFKSGRVDTCASLSFSRQKPVSLHPSPALGRRASLPFICKRYASPVLRATPPCQLRNVTGLAAAGALGSLEPEPEAQLTEKLEKLEELNEEMQQERKRLRALAPYLVASPTHGIVGASKFAEQLRRQVVTAARDPSRKAVLVFGEPGLQKSNIATLIHFGGPGREGPMAYLDCARLDPYGAELFGRGEKAGLVELVGDGTLLLKNVQKLNPALVPKLVRLCRDRTYRRAPVSPPSDRAFSLSSSDAPPDDLPPLQRAACRVIMTSNRQLPQLDAKVATVIKVPPLRLRPGDVKDLQRFYTRQFVRTLGSSATATPRLAVTPAAVKALESYAWPGNITELSQVVERAIIQGLDSATASQDGGRLTEEVFWFAKQAKDRFRLNLLATYPPLRRLLRSTLWPNDINFKFTAIVYPLIVALLLFGPQDRMHNPGLSLFWDYWWPLVFVSYIFLGRVWCAVCPFMIYGELAQAWRTSPAGGAFKLHKWPREEAERYGPIFLFSLFAAILVWEEVWDLPHTAALSGWLLIIITAGAVICSSIFERRLWCRYLCPIGGMNGLMAKLSITEVRARHGVCSGECSTYHCYKGGCAQPPEGLESPGCPLYSHPAQLTDNRNCVNCMECLKACPNGSVQFRLRPPGTDLWSGHTASVAEVSLMFMLQGAVFLHHLDALVGQLGLDPAALALHGVTWPHVSASVVVLAAPGLIAWGADAACRRNPHALASTGTFLSGLVSQAADRLGSGGGGQPAAPAGGGGAAAAAVAVPAAAAVDAPPVTPRPFLTLSYGYLPLLWASTLSHYLPSLLGEGGKVLLVTAAAVGWEDAPLPSVAADPAVINFLSGALLLFGAAASAALSRKLAAAPWVTFAPQVALIGLFTAELWSLILP